MRLLSQAAILACLFLLSGCLTIEETLRFSKDSTLVVSYVYTYPRLDERMVKESVRQLCRKENGEQSLCFFDEGEVRRYCEKNGMEFRDYRRTDIGDKVKVQIIILARDWQKPVNEGVFGPIKCIENDGKVRLEVQPRKENSLVLKDLPRECEGCRMQFMVVAPEKISSSNGNNVTSEIVSWSLGVEELDGSLQFNLPETMYVEWGK